MYHRLPTVCPAKTRRLTRLCDYAVWSESSLGVHVVFLNLKIALIYPKQLYSNGPTTEERMDKHDVYRTITFNRSCNVFEVNPIGKNSIRCQTYAKTEDHIELLFQFSASPALILSTTENATCVHFMKKSMHLKTGFLSDYQVLEWTTNRNKFIV